MKFYFEKLKLDELYGRTLSYNAESQKIIANPGMKPKGISKPVNFKNEYYTVYSINKEQYIKFKVSNFIPFAKCKHPDARRFKDLITQDVNESKFNSGNEETEENLKKRKQLYNELEYYLNPEFI